MNRTVVRLRQNVVLLGLALALVCSGAAPLLGGHGADAAKQGKDRKGSSAESRASPRATRRFENTAERLGIFDGGMASSSTIEVRGLVGPVADVNVNLIGLSHTPNSTQDIDVLLIGPEGRTALILSDVGGNTASINVTLVLDDQQQEQLPSNAALTNGFFQPTNVGSPDTMNLGNGPITPPSGASLGAFNGINPNGTWGIFVFDDQPNGSPQAGGGINGGWALTITTANGVPEAEADRFQAQAGKTLSVPASGVLENDSDPDGDALIATLVSRPQQGTVELEADGSFTYRAKKKAKGQDSFTYLAEDPSGLNAAATVDIQITGKKNKKGKKGGK